MNSMVQITVGGRAMLVAPKVADRVRKQVQINRERSIRLSRELKQSGLLPSGMFNQTAGRIPESYTQPGRERDSRQVWQDDKKAAIESRFHTFMLQGGY
jgi:hypothetical protein